MRNRITALDRRSVSTEPEEGTAATFSRFRFGVVAISAAAAAACGPPTPVPSAALVASGDWATEDVIEFVWQLQLSACAEAALSEIPAGELDEVRASLCSPDVYPGVVECDLAEFTALEGTWTFRFDIHAVLDGSGHFALGPLPAPESVDCDPYAELTRHWLFTPEMQIAGLNASPKRIRADGSVYEL